MEFVTYEHWELKRWPRKRDFSVPRILRLDCGRDLDFVGVSLRQSPFGGCEVSQGSCRLDALGAESTCSGRPFLAKAGKEQLWNRSRQRFCSASWKCSGAGRVLRAEGQ